MTCNQTLEDPNLSRFSWEVNDVDPAEMDEEEDEDEEAVKNAFCPTGEGGGVDPTCSPKGSGRQSITVARESKDRMLIDFQAGGKSVGSIEVLTDLRPVATTENLEIAKEHRGKGHAKRLYKDLFSTLKGKGFTEVWSSENLQETGEAVWKSLQKDIPAITYEKGVFKLKLSDLTDNAFCPTGPGGGQRNDCPPANAGGASAAPADRVRSLYQGIIKDWKSKSYKEIESDVDDITKGMRGPEVKQLLKDFDIAGTYGKKEGIQRIKDKITDLKRSREAVSVYDRPLKNGWRPVRTLNESMTIASAGDWLKKRGSMPGYGQIYKRGSHLWYVGGDGDEDGFADLVDEKLRAVAGVKKVTYEAESFPPEEEGWTLVYHPNPNKKVQ